MTQLDVLWWLTAALAGVAALMLAATMLSRVVQRSTDDRGQRIRNALLAELRTSTNTALLRKRVRKAAALGALAPLVLQVRDVLRGQSYEAFVSRLAAAGAANLLAKQLRMAAKPDRRRAAEALSVFSSDDARAALRLAWRDADPKARFAALMASAEMGDGPCFEHALTLALKPRCFPLAAQLLQRMAAQRPSEAADWLRHSSLAPPLVITLINGLAKASLDGGMLALVATLSRGHSNPDVRASALLALGERGSHQCKGAILDALEDDIWFVRLQAATAAGRLRIAEASAQLARLADDSSWWVRLRAGEALTRLEGRNA